MGVWVVTSLQSSVGILTQDLNRFDSFMSSVSENGNVEWVSVFYHTRVLSVRKIVVGMGEGKSEMILNKHRQFTLLEKALAAAEGNKSFNVSEIILTLFYSIFIE